MVTSTTLPAIEDCIELYLATEAAFGDDPFSVADLTGTDIDLSDSDLEELLTLLVAYGLVDRIDDRYRLRCVPNESISRWRERSAERAEALYRLIRDRRRTDRNTTNESDVELLERDGKSFVSVFVFERDDVESVATAAANALARNDSVTGIVLRSSGQRADHVQQLADRLCTTDVVERTRLESSFEKGFSDVVGDSKDALEFRLFLWTTDSASTA